MVKIADSEITVLKSSSHFVLSMSSHGLLYQAHVLSKFLNVVVSGCLISFLCVPYQISTQVYERRLWNNRAGCVDLIIIRPQR